MKRALHAVLFCCAVAAGHGADSPKAVAGGAAPLPVAQTKADKILLDGKSREVWKDATVLPVKGWGGSTFFQAELLQAGDRLLVGITAPETTAWEAREALWGSDLWRDDHVRIELHGQTNVAVTLNPLGAALVQLNGKGALAPLLDGRVQPAVALTDRAWRSEAAIDLRLAGGGPLAVRVTRERQPRGLQAFEAASEPPEAAPPRPLAIDRSAVASLHPVVTAPLPAPTRATRQLPVVSLAAAPDTEAEWAQIPSRALLPEEARISSDDFYQPGSVSAVLTATTIAFRVACADAFPDTVTWEERKLDRGDNVELFFGPAPLGYLQVRIAATGQAELLRSRTSGAGAELLPRPEWITVKTRRLAGGGWVALVAAPLDQVMAQLSAPPSFLPTAASWWVQVVRNRPERTGLNQTPQTSVFARTESEIAHCPLRFGRLQLLPAGAAAPADDAPAAVPLPPPVLNAAQRSQWQPTALLERMLQARTDAFRRKYEAQLAAVKDLDEWRNFSFQIRENLRRGILPALGFKRENGYQSGEFPRRGPLRVGSAYRLPGDGYVCEGVMFETLEGLPAAVTVFAPPGAASAKRPALIMVAGRHSHRNYQHQVAEGANFARAGGVALSFEPIGSAERCVTAFNDRTTYQAAVFGMQLQLAGDDLSGWTAFEVSRCVDYLLARGDVDPARIVVAGGSNGGGDMSGVASVVEPRIAGAILFNFNSTDKFGGFAPSLDFARSIRGARSGGFSSWMVNALIAPRRLVQGQEFGWGAPQQQVFDGVDRIFGFYDAATNHTKVYGGAETHAWQFLPVHRAAMNRVLNAWLQMSLPEEIPAEYIPPVKPDQLWCFNTPDGRRYLDEARAAGHGLEPFEVARQIAEQRRVLNAEKLANYGGAEMGGFGKLLEAPTTSLLATPARALRLGELPPWEGFPVRGLWLAAKTPEETTAGASAAWLLLPAGERPKEGNPCVIGVCRQGKRRFLAERSAQVRQALKAGVAVALVDLPGSGELSAGECRFPLATAAEQAQVAFQLEDSLVAVWCRELRAMTTAITGTGLVDATRLALWGEGFTAPNGNFGEPLRFEEGLVRQASPEPRTLLEPMGPLVCLLAAARERENGKPLFQAVLVRGGAAAFLTAFDSRYVYLPMDSILPGAVAAGDVPLLVAGLQKLRIPVLAEDLRDCRNCVLDRATLQGYWKTATPETYSATPTDSLIDRLCAPLINR